MFQLSKRDLSRLQGVHPDLKRVIDRASQLTPWPFMIVEGLRTKERQAQLVAAGASKTLNSRHLTGHAVDLAPVVDGEVRWDWPLYATLSRAVKDAAKAEKVSIVWGGDWRTFKDGPHFELDRRVYP
ncbi:M15 family peptidase [Azospirillum brasilense]|nr:M15 family peptidase [Azospirillum brasilense]